MSGLRRRIASFADTVVSMHAGTDAAVTGAELRVWVDEIGTSMMLRSISDPTTFEWPWMLGWWDSSFDRTVSLLVKTKEQLEQLGDFGQAEVAAALLDELDTGNTLANEGPEGARNLIDNFNRESRLTIGGALVLYFGARLALAVVERR